MVWGPWWGNGKVGGDGDGESDAGISVDTANRLPPVLRMYWSCAFAGPRPRRCFTSVRLVLIIEPHPQAQSHEIDGASRGRFLGCQPLALGGRCLGLASVWRWRLVVGDVQDWGLDVVARAIVKKRQGMDQVGVRTLKR